MLIIRKQIARKQKGATKKQRTIYESGREELDRPLGDGSNRDEERRKKQTHGGVAGNRDGMAEERKPNVISWMSAGAGRGEKGSPKAPRKEKSKHALQRRRRKVAGEKGLVKEPRYQRVEGGRAHKRARTANEKNESGRRKALPGKGTYPKEKGKEKVLGRNP